MKIQKIKKIARQIGVLSSILLLVACQQPAPSNILFFNLPTIKSTYNPLNQHYPVRLQVSDLRDSENVSYYNYRNLHTFDIIERELYPHPEPTQMFTQLMQQYLTTQGIPVQSQATTLLKVNILHFFAKIYPAKFNSRIESDIQFEVIVQGEKEFRKTFSQHMEHAGYAGYIGLTHGNIRVALEKNLLQLAKQLEKDQEITQAIRQANKPSIQ